MGNRELGDKYLVIVAVILAVLMPASSLFGKSPQVEVANITRSENKVEINPRFMADDQILYLEFTGDATEPRPWDYRLIMTDRFGYTLKPLTASGVVDYAVLPGQMEVLILFASSYRMGDALAVDFHNDIDEWQLKKLNISSGEFTPVALSHSDDLEVAYKLLGYSGLPDWEEESFISQSPDGHTEMLVRRELDGVAPMVRFYKNGAAESLLETNAFLTYGHFNWLPPITWEHNTVFLSLIFEGNQSPNNPQPGCRFSIVRVDALDGRCEVIYANPNINPFPAFTINRMRQELFFRKTKENCSILCRLDLQNGSVDNIFETTGELGHVESSLDGSHLLITRIEQDNSDIFRIDLGLSHAQPMAAN